MDYWLHSRLFQVQGTMGGYTWCRNGVVRRARRSDKAHFHSAPSLQRTRENAAEFGRASAAAKLLRQALRPHLEGLQTLALCARLTSRLRAVLGLDTAHAHGQRLVLPSNLHHLEGFDLNPQAPLSRFPTFSCRVALSAGHTLSLHLPGPDLPTTPPPGHTATHVQLLVSILLLDFTAGTHHVLPLSSPILPLGAPLPTHLSAPLPGHPASSLIVVLGLRFYQRVGEGLCPLTGRSARSLRIVCAGPRPWPPHPLSTALRRPCGRSLRRARHNPQLRPHRPPRPAESIASQSALSFPAFHLPPFSSQGLHGPRAPATKRAAPWKEPPQSCAAAVRASARGSPRLSTRQSARSFAWLPPVTVVSRSVYGAPAGLPVGRQRNRTANRWSRTDDLSVLPLPGSKHCSKPASRR